MGNPTVTPLVENWHDGGFLVSQANGHRSLDQVTLSSVAAAVVLAGTVLGKITTGASASYAALGTNTGNGTIGTITPVSTPTQIGTYSVVYTDATHFTVTAPDGKTATGVNGTPFSGLGIGFTMTTGGTAMVAGDGFTITITKTVGNPTFASAANAGNTGNSTMGSTSVTGYAPVLGAYKVEFDAATTFVVEDPTGTIIGHGATGTAFNAGGLGFTITAGGTAFVGGDMFVITVTAGSNKYRPWDPGNADGSQIVAGILWGQTDVTSADKPATLVARACEVNGSELIWPTGLIASQLAAGVAQLQSLGIIVR